MKVTGMDAAQTILTVNSTVQGAQNAVLPGIQKTNTSGGTSSSRSNGEQNDYPVTEKVMAEAVERVNKLLEGTSRSCKISVHEKTHEIMIQVIDDQTGKVVREVPPKKILDMVASMLEMAGLLVDERR